MVSGDRPVALPHGGGSGERKIPALRFLVEAPAHLVVVRFQSVLPGIDVGLGGTKLAIGIANGRERKLFHDDKTAQSSVDHQSNAGAVHLPRGGRLSLLVVGSNIAASSTYG